jgi:hypothetical protein
VGLSRAGLSGAVGGLLAGEAVDSALRDCPYCGTQGSVDDQGFCFVCARSQANHIAAVTQKVTTIAPISSSGFMR